MLILIDSIALDPVTDVRSGAESDESLKEFAARLDVEGLAQPVLVRPCPVLGGSPPYSVIAGRRRLAAFKLNGKTHIPAYVLDVDDETARRLAFEENYRRKQFSPVDLAKLFLEARGEKYQPNWSERVSKRFGVSRATVTETIKMYEGLAGSPELLAQVHAGTLASDAAILIAKQKEESGKLFEKAQEIAVQEATSKKAKIAKGSPRSDQGVAEAQPKAGKSVQKAADGKNAPNKPVKVQAKHVKQAARATGKSAGALNRAEIIDGLAKLANRPGYPPVMSAFLNYACTDWQAGKGSQEVLANHWQAVACLIAEDMKGCEELRADEFYKARLPEAVFGSKFIGTTGSESGRLTGNGPAPGISVVEHIERAKADRELAKTILKKMRATAKKQAAKKKASKPTPKPRKTAPAKTRKK
jgi:ParB family chromosome partitioning protein